MNKHYLKCRYGNKGFVLSLDAAIGVFLAVVLIVFAMTYSTPSSSFVGNAAVVLGSDVITAMDTMGILEGLDENEIEQSLSDLVSPQYGMYLDINCASTAITVGDSTPLQEDTYSGVRYFFTDSVVEDGEVCVARYTIWLQ